ncbi:MAG: hypothetical protein ACTHJT_11350 [Cytophaga sp.]|uniref:hypothetical protein n=1 Tax=Cytophaga sp. TaxID=29535 RepID=UPI003F7E0D60
MEHILKMLQPVTGKNLNIVINDNETNLYIFNWPELSEKHNALVVQMKGMSEEQMGEFLSHNSSDLMAIYDYFMDDDCIDKVENNEWLPIGVLGLSYPVNNFADMGHAGLLLLDLSADEENPPVIHFRDSEEDVIAESFRDLQINTND